MVKARHLNTKDHLHHLNTLLHGTSTEAQALVAYGSKKFHDSILHTLEQAKSVGAHLHHSLTKGEADVIDYLGNARISKTDRMKKLVEHTQSGGSWKKFARGFKKGFKSVFTPQNIETAATIAMMV